MSEIVEIGRDLLVMTIDRADAYFSPDNHARAADWAAADEPTRKGALAQSGRELAAYVSRDLVEPWPTDNVTRDDWAVMEQALEILDRQPRTTASSKVKKIGKPIEDERRGFRISPVALSFLRVPRLKWARG
jgi:hypothetical protein